MYIYIYILHNVHTGHGKVNHTMRDGIIVGLAVFILGHTWGIETDWGDCFLFQQYFNICISYDMN